MNRFNRAIRWPQSALKETGSFPISGSGGGFASTGRPTASIYALAVTDVDIGDFVDGCVLENTVKMYLVYQKLSSAIPDLVSGAMSRFRPHGVQVYRFMELSWEQMPALDSYVFAMAARPDDKRPKMDCVATAGRCRLGNNQQHDQLETAVGRLVYDYCRGY